MCTIMTLNPAFSIKQKLFLIEITQWRLNFVTSFLFLLLLHELPAGNYRRITSKNFTNSGLLIWPHCKSYFTLLNALTSSSSNQQPWNTLDLIRLMSKKWRGQKASWKIETSRKAEQSTSRLHFTLRHFRMVCRSASLCLRFCGEQMTMLW